MEPDRYQQSSKLFICGILCLLLSFILFAFGFYLLPHLIFGWYYDVPEFIANWREWFKTEYGFSEGWAIAAIDGIFLIPAFITAYISYRISNRIDNQIHHIYDETEDTTAPAAETRSGRESFFFILKILLLILLVILAVRFAEWLITTPAPTGP